MFKKFTQEEFLIKAKEKHNDLFDYSLIQYINIRTKVIIKCNTCNSVFKSTPQNHLSVSRCFRVNSTRLTLEEFIIKAKKVHDDKYDYSYVEYITKIKLKFFRTNSW